MLEGLKVWRSDGAAAAVAPDGPVPGPVGVGDRRRSERLELTGAEVYLFLGPEERYRLRLRDVCTAGVSGLTDAPLSEGEQVIVQFEEMLMPAADVIWTRRALVGFRFVNPLPLPRLKRLWERHASGAAWSPAMRAGSDLYCWWTDPSEQKAGRKPRLRAGGHKHPIPR
jgi:hypothetical protein